VELGNGAIEATLTRLLRAADPCPLGRLFSFRQEFSSEFNRLLHSPVGGSVSMTISDKHFPIFFSGHNLQIDEAVLVLGTPKDQSVQGFSISIDGTVVDEFSGDSNKWGGLPFKTLGVSAFSGGVLGEHSISVVNAGEHLRPDAPAPSDVSAVDSNKLSDIYLFVRYGLRNGGE
jgi:hypothetical protein